MENGINIVNQKVAKFLFAKPNRQINTMLNATNVKIKNIFLVNGTIYVSKTYNHGNIDIIEKIYPKIT